MVKQIVITLCWLVNLPLAAAIDVWVEPDNIDEAQTLNLNIQSTDMNAGNFDESPLETDFEIVSSRTNSQFRNVNGKIQSWISWRYILRPRSTGTLTIPALSIGGQTTESLTVHVRPLSADLKNQLDDTVLLETVLSAKTVYVQAQLILTRRLLYAAGFQQYGELPGPPDLNDAVVVYLGQRTPPAITRGGTRYQVFEQDYAIYPESSGTLHIPAAAITGSVRLGADRRRRGVRVQSKAAKVNVLGIPGNYPSGAAWLPAEQVQLSERWQPRSEDWQLGIPVTRTLLVKATASLGSIIAPLKMGAVNSHYKRYSEPVNISDITTPPAHGSREESYSYVAVLPGEQIIPVIEIPWFDTLNGEVRYARLPAKRIQIAGPTSVATIASQVNDREPTPPEHQTNAASPEFSWSNVWLWTILAIITCSGWLYAWRKHSKQPATTSGQSKKPLTELTRSIKQNEPGEIRRALARWLADLWSCTETEAFARLAQDEEGNRILSSLNATLYGFLDSPPPSKAQLTQLIARLKHANTKSANNSLPELYN